MYRNREKIRGAPTMSAIVWVNILLTLPFLIAFIGIPLWMTFKRPETARDHTEARAYLHTRTAFATALARRSAPVAHQPAGNPAQRGNVAA
jgi:hypothetical protein